MTSETNQDRHTEIPGYIMDLDISWVKKAVWGRVHALTKQEGYCYASNQYLADDLNISKRTLQRHLKDLKGDGLIHRDYNESGQRILFTDKPGDAQCHPPTNPSRGDDESVTPPPTNPSPPSYKRDEGKSTHESEQNTDAREESTIDIDWLLDEWAKHQPHDPSQSERQAQQNYVKYFDGYERQEVKEAMQGMNKLFEYEESGWGLKDLNNKFSKARGAFSENGNTQNSSGVDTSEPGMFDFEYYD
jgi:hypothetical protein